MMFSSAASQDLHQKPFQIKQDDKFFSRLLSKENSTANPSFRVYYGARSVAVPFTWESQPGTPKNTFCEDPLPPLTPPPSYYTNSKKNQSTINNKHPSRSNLLSFFFPYLNLKKTTLSISPSTTSASSTLSPTPSSASWYSTSLPVTPTTKFLKTGRFSSRGSLSFDSRACDHDEEEPVESPTSTLCFSISRAASSGRGRRHGWWS